MHELPGGGDRLFRSHVSVAVFDKEMAVVADQERPEVIPQVKHDLGAKVGLSRVDEGHSGHITLHTITAAGQLYQLRLMAVLLGIGLDLFGQWGVDGSADVHREV